MNIIETVDDGGFKRRYAINEDDDPNEAVDIGIDVGVPDLSQIDWDALHLEIHNALYDAQLFDRDDILRSGSRVSSIVKVAVTRKLINLYGV